jgi:hypothetical protein
MGKLEAVPAEDVPEQLAIAIGEFEGLSVARSRMGSVPTGEFAALDEDGNALTLLDGDTVVVQLEVIVTGVEFGASYKGGIRISSRDRVHKGHTLEGSQQIVGLKRASRA